MLRLNGARLRCFRRRDARLDKLLTPSAGNFSNKQCLRLKVARFIIFLAYHSPFVRYTQINTERIQIIAIDQIKTNIHKTQTRRNYVRQMCSDPQRNERAPVAHHIVIIYALYFVRIDRLIQMDHLDECTRRVLSTNYHKKYQTPIQLFDAEGMHVGDLDQLSN